MLELEPLHEEAHRTLMWFLAIGGQRGAALAQFETCHYLLREELGQDPSPATVALRDQITHTGGFTSLPLVGTCLWTTPAPQLAVRLPSRLGPPIPVGRGPARPARPGRPRPVGRGRAHPARLGRSLR
jgi:hypothetical protein